MTSAEQPDKPHTWLPLVVAGSVTLLVVAGAVTTHLLRSELAPQKKAAVAACEAQLAKQFPTGPGITGGDIYSAREWRDLDARLVGLGLVQEQSLTGEQADARDDEADALIAAGEEQMTIVWQLDDESHAQCVAELKDGTVTSATVTTLAEATVSPSPSPSAP